MRMQARSSVGERHLDVVDVVGSIPSAPTSKRLKDNDAGNLSCGL